MSSLLRILTPLLNINRVSSLSYTRMYIQIYKTKDSISSAFLEISPTQEATSKDIAIKSSLMSFLHTSGGCEYRRRSAAVNEEADVNKGWFRYTRSRHKHWSGALGQPSPSSRPRQEQLQKITRRKSKYM